jgi:cyclic pyranopterin phosphate synthase
MDVMKGAPGSTRMIDVGAKPPTERRAVAECRLTLPPGSGREVTKRLEEGRGTAADRLETARLAGILAGKRTAEILPLCHPLPLDHLAVEFAMGKDRVRITATAATRASTGVEMEALTAAAFAGLTLRSLLGPAAAGARLDAVRLLRKTGGRSGDFTVPEIE